MSSNDLAMHQSVKEFEQSQPDLKQSSSLPIFVPPPSTVTVTALKRKVKVAGFLHSPVALCQRSERRGPSAVIGNSWGRGLGLQTVPWDLMGRAKACLFIDEEREESRDNSEALVMIGVKRRASKLRR